MPVEKGNKVKIEYKAMFENGDVFDSSKDFEFEVGSGNVIKGVDEAIVGMERGDEKNLTIQPDKAYGPHQEKYVIEIPKGQIKGDVKVGMVIKSSTGLVGKVIEVGEDTIKVDFNHPLSGKTLKFWIKVVDYQ